MVIVAALIFITQTSIDEFASDYPDLTPFHNYQQWRSKFFGEVVEAIMVFHGRKITNSRFESLLY